MLKRTLMLCLAVIMTLSIVLTGCSNKAADQQATATNTPQKEKAIKLSVLDGEPSNIDPQIGTDLNSIFIGGHVLEGLVRVYDGKVQPGMAEKWDVSPDGLTYTFHLRDAKWSDGQPVKAQDFEYSIMRLLDPKTAASYAEVMGVYIKNADKFIKGEITDKSQVGVKVIDDKTLQITLESPTGYFLRLLGFMCFLPSREDLVAKYGEAYASDPDKMVFNGPYVLKDWQHEQELTLAKNTNYWDKDNVKMDTITLPIINDAKTSISMFETGEVQFSSVPAEMIDQYKQNGQAKFMMNGGDWYLQFNFGSKTNSKILANKNFRLAVSYAIDRDSLVNAVIKSAKPANRYVPDNIMGMNDKFAAENPLDVLPAKADEAKAKEYFNKALQELNLTPATFPKLKLLGGDAPSTKQFCEAVQDMLFKTLGIKLELTNVPGKQRLQMISDRDYEIAWTNWYPDYDDPMTYLDLWVTGGSFNRSNYSNPNYDALIKDAKSATDEKTRQQDMFNAEKLLMDDMAIVPVYWAENIYVQSDKLVNFIRSMVGSDPDLTYVDIKE